MTSNSPSVIGRFYSGTAEYGRVPPADHLGHHEAQVDSRLADS
jgi:hypothetical protein